MTFPGRDYQYYPNAISGEQNWDFPFCIIEKSARFLCFENSFPPLEVVSIGPSVHWSVTSFFFLGSEQPQ